ncbi:MAG: thiamine-phosphate kinase [Pseudomonadota bacterium]
MKSKTQALSREAALIAALHERFGPAPPEVILGIGDDCAAISLDGSDYLLWTMDTLVEGVHFDLSYTPLEKLGWKALAVNLSDIAAMGGEPRYALLSLGWPPRRDRAGALTLADGLARAAREYGVAVIGGDTVASPGGLAVTLTLTGVVDAAQMLRRAGAQAGDLVYVTGTLGEAAAGLEILKRGVEMDQELKEALIEAHLAPRPQLQAGRVLARQGLATALIDLSDGVATDLSHLCRASGVGARIRGAAVPISAGLAAAASLLGRDPLQLALTGGEDYQLLFTCPPALAASCPGLFPRPAWRRPGPWGKSWPAPASCWSRRRGKWTSRGEATTISGLTRRRKKFNMELMEPNLQTRRTPGTHASY